MTDRSYDSDYGECERYAAIHRQHVRRRQWREYADTALLLGTAWSPILAAACLYWYAAEGATVYRTLTGAFTLAFIGGLAVLIRRGQR